MSIPPASNLAGHRNLLLMLLGPQRGLCSPGTDISRRPGRESCGEPGSAGAGPRALPPCTPNGLHCGRGELLGISLNAGDGAAPQHTWLWKKNEMSEGGNSMEKCVQLKQTGHCLLMLGLLFMSFQYNPALNITQLPVRTCSRKPSPILSLEV